MFTLMLETPTTKIATRIKKVAEHRNPEHIIHEIHGRCEESWNCFCVRQEVKGNEEYRWFSANEFIEEFDCIPEWMGIVPQC